MKEFMSVHHPIIYTGFKDLISMFLQIEMMVHFVFNAWMQVKEQNQLVENVIYSLM